MDKRMRVPPYLGRLFNRLPGRWRRRGVWAYYFSNGYLSCLNWKQFDGWYWVTRR